MEELQPNEILFNIYATRGKGDTRPIAEANSREIMTLPVGDRYLNEINRHHSRTQENGFSRIGFIAYEKMGGKTILTKRLFPKEGLQKNLGERCYPRLGSAMELKILEYLEKQGVRHVIGTNDPSNSRLFQQARMNILKLSPREKTGLQKELDGYKTGYRLKLLAEMRGDGRLPVKTPIEQMISALTNYADSTQ